MCHLKLGPLALVRILVLRSHVLQRGQLFKATGGDACNVVSVEVTLFRTGECVRKTEQETVQEKHWQCSQDANMSRQQVQARAADGRVLLYSRYPCSSLTDVSAMSSHRMHR